MGPTWANLGPTWLQLGLILEIKTKVLRGRGCIFQLFDDLRVNLSKIVSRWRQEAPKTPQDGPKRPQDTPRRRQVGPKMAPRRPQDGQVPSESSPKRPPSWHLLGHVRPSCFQDGSKTPPDRNLTPTWAQLGPTWPHLGLIFVAKMSISCGRGCIFQLFGELPFKMSKIA